MKVAKTKSGKEIEFQEGEMAAFDFFEFFEGIELMEAHCVFEALSARALRREGEEGVWKKKYETLSQFIKCDLIGENFEDLKKLLNLHTSADIVRLGFSLLAPEFKD